MTDGVGENALDDGSVVSRYDVISVRHARPGVRSLYVGLSDPVANHGLELDEAVMHLIDVDVGAIAWQKVGDDAGFLVVRVLLLRGAATNANSLHVLRGSQS